MLIKRKSQDAARTRLAGLAGGLTSGVMDRRTFLARSGLTAAGGSRRRRADAGRGAPGRGDLGPGAGRRDHRAEEHVHPLFGGMHRPCGSAERCLDRSGAGLGEPDQPWHALRQGRFGARDRPWRAPGEIPDEARRRAVAAHLLGSGLRRDRRQDARDPGEVGCRFRLHPRLGEIHQRSLLSAAQIRCLLGHQQRRPSGAHLPFDHRRGRRQHLGLRRPDQLLQRHPQLQDHDHHGRQSGRSPSDLDAARALRQGDQPRQHDRHRPPHDAHGRSCDRICPHPLGHGYSGHLGDDVAHHQERLGGQGLPGQARLRHVRGAQGSGEVGPEDGRGRHRRSRRAA